MEKRTLLAVVLSILVITGFYLIQGIFFPPAPPSPRPAAEEPVSQAPSLETREQFSTGDREISSPGLEDPAGEIEEEIAEQRIVIETELIRVVLSNTGGDIVSYKLKEHQDQGDLVEMILSGTGGESHAFTVAFGGASAKPLTSRFKVRRLSNYAVEFAQDFTLNGSQGRFTLVKRYEFKPRDYMFELNILLDGGHSVNSFKFPGGAAYTLGFGPQIGPRFDKLDQRYEYRRYLTFNKKIKQEKVSENAPAVINSQPAWAAIAGKYFTIIALPYASQYEITMAAWPEPGLSAASRLFITRPSSAGNVSRIEDMYRFYLGPKNQESLGVYDTGKNDFNLQGLQLIEAADNRGVLAPLEKLLKLFLTFFHMLIPNYGVAIILTTLIVKLILFPLTKKGSESTLRMQALAPKIKEIQEKYRDNPQKMNAEMGEFYKREGYNPLSGCLPMLVQIPIFFAMYNLFNNHFDLRGAMFIPGWIPDLSLPESVYNFAPFQLPFLGWSDIRLLPFIYVGSQLLYGKVTQTPDQQGNPQMKLMLYAMPVIFFFILYDVPSGLLLYWIMSNVLTMVQQVIINKYMAAKKAAMAEAAPEREPIIAPKRKKKR